MPKLAFNVLEVGAGLGYFAQAFLKHAHRILGHSPALSYTIWDCSRALLADQKELLRDAACSIRFLEGEAEAARGVLGSYRDTLMFEKGDTEAFARRLKSLMEASEAEKAAMTASLRVTVVEHHNLDALIEKLVASLQ